MEKLPQPRSGCGGFDASILTGLLDVGVPQRFLRTLLVSFAGPDEWRDAAPLPGEDLRWRSVPPREPGCDAFVLGGEGYPWLLSGMPAAPVVLYAEGLRGGASPASEAMVCLSGSRTLGAMGRAVVDVVVDALGVLGAGLVCGTEAGVEEHAARSAAGRGVPTTLVASCGLRAGSPRIAALHGDVLSSGGVVVSTFADGVRASSFTAQASYRLLARLACPLVVAEADVPSASTALAGEVLRAGSSLLVPIPRPAFRDAPGARGLLALAGLGHEELLGWGDDLRAHGGVNGFANAVAETGDELRTLLSVLWWLRPRGAVDARRRGGTPR